MLGERGPFHMGIPDHYSVAEAKRNRRRRNHRVDILNQIEEEISKFGMYQDEDVVLWKHAEGKFMSKYSTSKTWEQLRDKRSVCSWNKGVWFPQSTPKYAFMMWVTLKERLQTADRMQQWNHSINPACVLCDNASESSVHLFFECRYSEHIWRNLVEGLMQEGYTAVLSDLIVIVSKPWLTPIKRFILRYILQAAMHMIWWERNACKHGEKPRDLTNLSKLVEKNVKLKLLAVKERGDYFEDGLIIWFGVRPNT